MASWLRSHWPWWILSLGVAAPLTVATMPSADLWWHLALGREVWRSGHIPATDPFSFTAAGAPWQNDQWLGGTLLYLGYLLSGLRGLEIGKSIILLGAVGVASWHAWRRGRAPLALPLACAAAVFFAEPWAFFDLRPQIVSYLMLTVFLWLLYEYANGQRWILFALPLLTVLWANIHPGFLIGPAMLMLAAAGLWLEGRRSGARDLAICTLVCVAASCLNWNGWHMLLYPFRLHGSDIWGTYLNEWEPLISARGVRGGSMPFTLFLAMSLIMLAAMRQQFAAWELSTLVPLGLFTLTGWRHVPLFCFAIIPAWCVVLGLALKKVESGRLLAAMAAAAGVALVGFTLSRPQIGQQIPETRFFPRWATDFLMANDLPKRLFHPYGWGGYLEWKLDHSYQVFIDGRAITVYPADCYKRYLDAAYNRDHTTAVLDADQVRVAMCFRDPRMTEASSRLFDHDPRWEPVYQDDFSMIFVRVVPETAALLERARAHRLVYPPNPYLLTQEAQQAALTNVAAATELALQAHKLDHTYAEADYLLGALALRQGQAEEGLRWTRAALRADPQLPNAHFNLGVYYQLHHDAAAARREFEAELRSNPSNQQARQRLQSL